MSLPTENDFFRIYERLELDILSGFFKPRERLIEKELCQRYQASRGTIRKVLQELEFNHLVKHFSNRGATVAEPTKKEMHDIFNSRLLLENHAIDMAMQNSNAFDLERIVHYQQAFENAVANGDLKGIVAANRMFHQQIYEACDNAVVMEMIDQLRKRSHVWQHYIVGHADRMHVTMEEHDAMVRSLEKIDGPGLKKINETHLTRGYKSYMEDLMVTAQ